MEEATDNMGSIHNVGVVLDRISNLPEPILHHIMSFLPFKQVVQTSVLSKTWQQVWNRFQVLEFDSSVFNWDLNYHYDGRIDPKRERKFLNLLNSVEEALRNRYEQVIIIDKLSLDLTYICVRLEEHKPSIDRCICYAIGCNVKELKLHFPPHHIEDDCPFSLPQVVLCSKSTEILSLTDCKLESPTNNMKTSSLRKLYLTRVNAADQVIENLIAGCPLIEDLTLDSCQGLKSLELCGYSKLNNITMLSTKELKRVVVKGLNVHSIAIGGPFIPYLIDVASCKNLKSLQFYSASITDEWLCNQISKFPVLECLRIANCEELRRVKISSLQLKTLYIRHCMKLAEVKIETPNLRKFTYVGDVISFSTCDALTLSETDLCFFSDNMDAQWFVKYVELLARFNSFSKVLNLQVRRAENVIVPEEVRQILPSPFSSVEHLNLAVIRKPPAVAAVKTAVDGLLWMSPHAKIVSIESRKIASIEPDYASYDYFKFQFSYKKQPVYEGGIAQCCKSAPISCWRQCIEEVEIEFTHTGNKHADGNEVRRCIVKGEEIWEKIGCCLADLATS